MESLAKTLNEKVPLPPGKTTYTAQQQEYRYTAWQFFANDENYARLKRIHEGGDALASLIFYYVKEYKSSRLVQTKDGFMRMCDEYASAISSFKKRYYDFEGKIGVSTTKDNLFWGGELNPGVRARPDSDEVVLALPRLKAFLWFIDHDFDLLLWKEYDDVFVEYSHVSSLTKQRYTRTHQQKKRTERRRVEQLVIGKRKDAEQGKGKGRKRAYLTREERQMVKTIMEEKRKERREKRAKQVKHKRRKTQPKHPRNAGLEITEIKDFTLQA